MPSSIGPIQHILKEEYCLSGELSPLPGDTDTNYILTPTGDPSLLVKISSEGRDLHIIQMELAISQYLQEHLPSFSIPRTIPTKHGKDYVNHDLNGILRIQTFLPGRLLSDVQPRSYTILHQWGQLCGHVSKVLRHFDHPAAHRTYSWDPIQTLSLKEYVKYFDSQEDVHIARHFWELFERDVAPRLPHLRKSVNHNDIHEHNVLVNPDDENPTIIGLIDFGDAVYTTTVNEIAIASAYAAMSTNDPVDTIAQMIHGYHEVFPLEEKEVDVIYGLVTARLLATVCHSAKRAKSSDGEPYHQVHAERARNLLYELRQISPSFATYSFRRACGWEPHPKHQLFHNWIASQNEAVHSVVKVELENVASMDLSVGSQQLGNYKNYETYAAFDKQVRRYLEDRNRSFGIGGYGEFRPIYTTDAYLVRGNHGAQWRTCHLGIDFWGSADTPVYAPLDGEVVSATDNDADRDYGPTIILKHEVTPDLTFYTLYGHLSRNSLKGLSAGMKIKRGQKFTTIGPAPENGNWPPHLHFQVILNLLDHVGDFPGVAFPHEAEVMKSNCPNPSAFFSCTAATNPIPALEQLIHRRSKNLGKNLSLSYKDPLHIVRGKGSYLYHVEGRRYLDTVNNVAHVGHEHPRIVRAANKQNNLLNTNTRYAHEAILEYAEQLLTRFPSQLSRVYFVNSGSEANELALRMARTATNRQDVVAMAYGYHGNTGNTIDASHYKFGKLPSTNQPTTTQVLPLPDLYQDRHLSNKNLSEHYIQQANQTIEDWTGQGLRPAAFIGEAILSCAGQVPLPEGYLSSVYRMIRNNGGICIADEVQIGFGRVGQHFWGYELQGAIPDIVTLGKPMGNGYPIGAVVCTEAVADAFDNGIEFFSTFGGNPVACRTGLEVLKVIEDEELQINALRTGQYLKDELMNLQSEFPIIGDIRGSGLFLGIEFVLDPGTRKPAKKEANYFVNRMRQLGVLMSTDGYNENVIKIKPPMCFNLSNVDFLIDNMNHVLSDNFLAK